MTLEMKCIWTLLSEVWICLEKYPGYIGYMFKMLRKEKQYDSSLKITYGIIIWSSNSALNIYLEELNQGLKERFVQLCS